MIELAQPDLSGRELDYVVDCIRSGWISSHGEYIGRFEKLCADLAGTEFAVATNNGTTALHLALVALGVRPGDEVIVPTVTYVATANAVAYCGATPVLVDVLPGSLNIDPVAVEAAIGPRTVGILPVHLYGQPAEMASLLGLASDRGLWVLEDAAEAHGASIASRRVGSFGIAGTFSFFGNKVVTTGEGGAVTTNDEELAKTLRLYRGQGMDPSRRYWFPVTGFNYRMTNIQAALGVAQLERFETLFARRAAIESLYDEALSGLRDRLEIRESDATTVSAPWLYTVFLREADEATRDFVMARMRDLGVDTRPVFYPMHTLPMFASTASFPIADDWSRRGISLPTHTGLTDGNIIEVAQALRDALDT